MSSKSHSLVLELLGDVSRARAGDFDPGLGEDSAGGDDEGDVDDSVERVDESGLERVRSGDIVSDTGNGGKLRWRVLEGLDVSATHGKAPVNSPPRHREA